MTRKNNLIGLRYGILEVVSDSGQRNKSKDVMWLCRCDCGNTTTARAFDLRRGDYQSCGCIKSSLISEKNSTHGMASTAIYSIWHGMVQRCTNPNASGWEDYGGRGITVSASWLDFENFYRAMGDRPSELLSIDRKNNNEGYCFENCRWATKSEQAFNRRKQKSCTSSTVNVYFNKKSQKWMARSYDGKVRKYLGMFSTEQEAKEALLNE